jgi:ribose transport system ATP-binding protein
MTTANTVLSGTEPLVSVRSLSKHFGGQYALRDVDLDLLPGEVHALLGGNGAGKSTLIKILAGVVSRDAGEITLQGRPAHGNYTTATARHGGLAFVHQDLGLIANMTVAENIALSVGYRRRHGLVSFADTHDQARRLLDRIGLELDPGALVRDLPQDARVMVAVARAFGADARAVVLDEVSSSLPAPDVARLAGSLRAAADAGIGFLYVTHRLDELDGLADRVTVFRDGRKLATHAFHDVSHDEIVELIVGQPPTGGMAPRRAWAPRDEAGQPLAVRDLAGPGLAQPLSFSAQPGEILGVCGLVGCGSRNLAMLLGGALRPTSGTATLGGATLPLGRPSALRRSGCAYVPGDRQAEGAVAGMGVRENLFLSRISRGGDLDGIFKRPRRERAAAAKIAERLDVRPRADLEKPLSTLSGGNQQKVVAGRAIRSSPRLLVVDDPTAGVDVGARADLHTTLRGAAAAGAVVILASSDYDEVAALADRVLVMVAGRVVAELSGEDITSDALAKNSYFNDNRTREPS